MIRLLALGLAGAVGTISRYWLTGLAQRYAGDSFPLGTLVVNVLGCFLIGVVVYRAGDHPMLSPETRLVMVAGFLGAFTTFSAFGYDSFELLRRGAVFVAALNIAGSVILGLGAVGLGAWAARLLAA